jgi:hypothetical protein
MAGRNRGNQAADPPDGTSGIDTTYLGCFLAKNSGTGPGSRVNGFPLPRVGWCAVGGGDSGMTDCFTYGQPILWAGGPRRAPKYLGVARRSRFT